jgi:hypothetical protein
VLAVRRSARVGAAVEFASDLAGIARKYDADPRTERKTDHGPASDLGSTGRRPGQGGQNTNAAEA